MREVSLQECLREIESDGGGANRDNYSMCGEGVDDIQSFISADGRPQAAATTSPLDLSKPKKVRGKKKEVFNSKEEGSSSDDKLPLSCGISQKEKIKKISII